MTAFAVVYVYDGWVSSGLVVGADAERARELMANRLREREERYEGENTWSIVAVVPLGEGVYNAAEFVPPKQKEM